MEPQGALCEQRLDQARHQGTRVIAPSERCMNNMSKVVTQMYEGVKELDAIHCVHDIQKRYMIMFCAGEHLSSFMMNKFLISIP